MLEEVDAPHAAALAGDTAAGGTAVQAAAPLQRARVRLAASNSVAPSARTISTAAGTASAASPPAALVQVGFCFRITLSILP
jgi:hypothetical protein